MPLDGISAKCLATELNTRLAEARVDRIYQPDRYDILILLRAGRENLRLILSANPAAPRIHLTAESRENPSEPPMFCMLLRKHLLGARIISVETPDFERIFFIRFQTTNELGDSLEKKLVIEIMGRHSNIIFLNQENRIHDAILHVDQAVSRLREIMPARLYAVPQNQTKPTPEQVLDRIRNSHSPLLAEVSDRPLAKALLESIQGFSPQLCQETCEQASLDPRLRPSQLSTGDWASLNATLQNLLTTILEGQFSPSTFYLQPNDTIPQDFHALNLQSLANRRPANSLSEAMDLFYLERNRQNKIAQQRQSLLKRVEQELENAAKKLQIHESELRDGENRDQYRRWGELLVSQPHLVREGQTSVELQDYFDPDLATIHIEIQPNRSAAQNAQRYFKLYQKARGKFEANSRWVIEDRQDVAWLESLLSAVQNAVDEDDIRAIREEISATGLSSAERRKFESPSNPNGYHSSDRDRSAAQPTEINRDHLPGKPGSRTKRQARLSQQLAQQGKSSGKGKNKAKSAAAKSPPPLPPRAYLSSDGILIQAGRNNLQNDRLTLRTAQKDDIWLHAQKIPGTHVIIRSGHREVPPRTLEEAAQIAAWYSQASPGTGENPGQNQRDLSESPAYHKIAVDYCPVSHVKKIAGARPGLVQYDHYQTILVQPRDPKLFLSEPKANPDEPDL